MKNVVWKKRFRPMRTFLLMLGLYLMTGMPKVHAAQVPVSHGSLIYEDERGGADLYAADILLLNEKLSSIPEQCFDPLRYAHTHIWEYREINERTHTRHCADCGDANDLTGAHRAERWERDTIFYGGKSYPAQRFVCDCGYQWRMELAHNLIYEAVDEMSHRGRCALEGTPYCPGCEPSVEEHYAWYYEMGADDSHHTKICFDCGYRIEESCRFFKEEEGEGPPACVCGRTAEAEDETPAGDQPDTEEEPPAPDQPDTEEEPPAPDQPDTEEEPPAPDQPDTEEEPPAPDQPDTEEEPPAPDQPDTEEEPPAPDQPDQPNTEEEPPALNQPDKEGEPPAPNQPDTEDGPPASDQPGTRGRTSGTEEIIIISGRAELICPFGEAE